MSDRREAFRRELEESDSSSDLNVDLDSESTAPPNLAITQSQLNTINEEESEDEPNEELHSTVGSVMQRVGEMLDDESSEISE